MNLQTINDEIDDFIKRISNTLNLYKCSEGMLANQKKVCSWVRSQFEKRKRLQDEQEKMKKGYVKKILNVFSRKQMEKQKDPLAVDLTLLSGFIKKGVIPKGFAFVSNQVPKDIKGAVNALKGRKFQNYYGYVKGPFISDLFILKKQDFHSVIEQVEMNHLKFLMIQEKVAHKYQRNLVQQIFGRIFRQKGCLSLVLKIQVNFDPFEPPYNLFCYIEDRKLKDEIDWQPLSSLHKNFNKLEIQTKKNVLEISEIGMLDIFLSQILVLPLQSLVSDFIVWIKKDSAELVKCNQQSQQQIIKQTSLKDHPSLRNPLLYFREYLQEHSIKISDAQKVTINKDLYACFYKCLDIVVELILTDFQTEANDMMINSSLCFNEEVFSALWITFHKINLLSGWMKEVIEPVKNTITISQVIQHFCPIFNQISVYQTENFEYYRDFFLKLQMESYLATVVKKTSLQKYKDMYVSAGETVISKKLTSPPDIYNHIFRPILHQANLLYSDPVEVAYIFNFCCKCLFQYKPVQKQIEEKWKDPIIWERSIKVMQKQELPFIDIGFDFMSFACGINSYQVDPKCFERINYSTQSSVLLEGIINFIRILKQKYEKQSQFILSSLLQKSFKHKKFKVCTLLLEKNVQIRDFNQIINSQQAEELINQQTKESILKTIKEQSPQMHRLYTWQQHMIVHLKQKQLDTVPIDTLQYGKIHLPKSIFEGNIKNGKVVNNLSRKDCRFNINKQISYVELGNGLSFYLESSQFPLMSYFYKFFLTQLGAQKLMFNFASFFYENRMYKISESLTRGINYKKGLLTYTEQELNSMASIQLLSQAIILSMILIPSQVYLQDVIICPSDSNSGEILIIDWHSFYNKNFMAKYIGKVRLNTRNSLFTMQIMHKAIDPKVMNKYANIDVMKICENVFNQSKKFSEVVHEMYRIKENTQQPTKQHMAMIFESGFIFNLAERMFKIKRAFDTKSSNYQKGLSYYKLLQILHGETSYYYQQLYSTSVMLKERQLALSDENWKRSFLHSNIIQFFGGFRKLEDIQNIFPDHYYRFCFQGPTESLADVTMHVKKFKAFSKENPQIFKNYNNEFFEYIMKNIDLSTFNSQQREQFIEIIKSKSIQHLQSSEKKVLPLSFIRLKSIFFLKQTYLDNFSFERVQQLIIESCTLTIHDIKNFPYALCNVTYLQLREIKGIKYIGENSMPGQPIQIKHLKTLSIINCNELVSIDLKCDILESMQLRNNEQLENVFIYSLDLKNIYLYNNPNISVQNIGIYILKGINVLLCRNSCRGDISKLYSTNYDTYVNNILKHMLISFFVKENRHIMLLTLFKMKEVDENLFSKAVTNSLRSFSIIFNRFSVEVQDSLLAEIFRLYFSNRYLNQVVIGELLIQAQNTINQLQISRLFKVISFGLSKINNQKPFLSLKFENSQMIFKNLLRTEIKALIDKLRTEKYFELTFSNLNFTAFNSYQNQKEIELIRYISMQKDGIQKMSLSIKKSTISIEFFNQIFKDTFTLEEMKKQEQEMIRQSVRTKMSRLSARRSINQQYPKHMKINMIQLEKCEVQDFIQGLQNGEQQQRRQNKVLNSQPHHLLEQIHRTESLPLGLIQIKENFENNPIKQVASMSINFNSLMPKKLIDFGSVRQLKMLKCNLSSFSLVEKMPNLVLLSVNKCNILENSIFYHQINDIVNDFFGLIGRKELHTLELEGFFNNTVDSEKWFNKLCEILTETKSIKVLKLNENVFTFSNLIKLNIILNETSIEELQLDRISLFEKATDLKMSYDESKIQLISELRQKKEQQNAVYLKQLFSSTKNLKGLVIQLRSLKYLQQFVKSVSKNQTLLYLKLNTHYEIPSYILTPLKQSNTLTHISSNMQLPIWLLNHVNSNRRGGKHKEMKEQSNILKQHEQVTLDINDVNVSKNEDDSLINALSNALINNSRFNDCYRMGLSLDGGGIRGMLLATQLDYLSKNVGYPLHKIFDCIGGTSIGGILALLSTGTIDGYNPMATPEQLMGLFVKYGKDIFKKSQFRQITSLFDTKYSPTSFEEVLKNYFKDCKLSNCLQQTSVIVTAVNRVDNKDYIFRSNEALLNRQKDFYMRDVARATSAAPTYFPSAEIKNINATMKLSLLDGGMGINNPSKLVIDEVMKISSNSAAADNYFLLSLGTGKLPTKTIPQSAGLKDISPIIDSFAQSSNYFLQRDLSINYKGHFYRVSPSINLVDKSKGELDNTSDEIVQIYRQTGLQASKKFFSNTVIFGKNRIMNLIEWLRENTQRKYQF